MSSFLKIAGTIRNTEPLDYERSHNHILSVVAYDCGMKQSQPVMVTVKVNRICKVGWKGKVAIFYFFFSLKFAKIIMPLTFIPLLYQVV